MSLAKDLLGQAAFLATLEPKRPKQASLRRAVSTAYYAVFHLLTAEAVAVVGPNLSAATAFKVQRWFDHAEMKKVCGIFANPTIQKEYSSMLDGDVSADLRAVTLAFLRLQEARHSADYDLGSSLTRVTVQQHLQVATDAFSAWARIRKSHEANVFSLALLSAKLFERRDRV